MTTDVEMEGTSFFTLSVCPYVRLFICTGSESNNFCRENLRFCVKARIIRAAIIHIFIKKNRVFLLYRGILSSFKSFV